MFLEQSHNLQFPADWATIGRARRGATLGVNVVCFQDAKTDVRFFSTPRRKD